MNRSEFMFALAQLLADLPLEERSEALKFYNNYFDDAGPENEQQIIEELISPKHVAQSIHAGLDGSAGEGEYREDGYHETYDAGAQHPVYMQAHKQEEHRDSFASGADAAHTQNMQYRTKDDGEGRRTQEKGRRMPIVLIVILCICASPVLLGFGGGLIGLIVGMFGGLIGIIAGVLGGVLGGIFGGIGGFVHGIYVCFSNPADGLALCGAGLLAFAVGILCLMLLVWCCKTVFPAAVRLVHKLFVKIFGRRRAK